MPENPIELYRKIVFSTLNPPAVKVSRSSTNSRRKDFINSPIRSYGLKSKTPLPKVNAMNLSLRIRQSISYKKVINNGTCFPLISSLSPKSKELCTPFNAQSAVSPKGFFSFLEKPSLSMFPFLRSHSRRLRKKKFNL